MSILNTSPNDSLIGQVRDYFNIYVWKGYNTEVYVKNINRVVSLMPTESLAVPEILIEHFQKELPLTLVGEHPIIRVSRDFANNSLMFSIYAQFDLKIILYSKNSEDPYMPDFIYSQWCNLTHKKISGVLIG